MVNKKKNTTAAVITGAVVVLIILIFGTVWMGRAAKQDTDNAVRTVSHLYLDELAGRREQVIESNLKENIDTINTAVDLMTEEDLSDEEHRQAYQQRVKSLYHLERFALVGESGTIYTSNGPIEDIDRYSFDYRALTEPDISVSNIESKDKKVVIAVPIAPRTFGDDKLVVYARY